jgi:hypothetical protein
LESGLAGGAGETAFLLIAEARRETGNIISGGLFLADIYVRLYIRIEFCKIAG